VPERRDDPRETVRRSTTRPPPGLARRCVDAFKRYPWSRHGLWLASGALALTFAIAWAAFARGGTAALGFAVLAVVGWRDTRQRRHALLRNYPLMGHLRFFLEYVRPEIRQYFIEGDNEQAPFSRQQRSLVYQRAKGAPDKRPFGTQLDVQANGYEWINHSLVPTEIKSHDFRVTIGSSPGCLQPYRASVFNISALSFGALSANAILALNAGAKKGGFTAAT
jgi:glutamate synthase domain-containing protein 2